MRRGQVSSVALKACLVMLAIGPGTWHAGVVHAQRQDPADRTLGLGQTITRTPLNRLDPPAKDRCINVQDFGADPTNTTDSSAAFDSAFANAKATGYPLCLQAGIYRISRAISWDLASTARTGINIAGDGARKVILDFTQDNVPAPNLKLFSSSSEGVFFVRMGGFSIQSNVDGAALQIGETALTDAINSAIFGPLIITNNSPGARATGVQINYVVNSTFVQLVANLGGANIGLDAIQLNQSVSNTFINAAGGNCQTSLRLTNGSNYGNTFIGFDFEEATTGVKIDNANSFSNTWIGGTAASLRYFAQAAAGRDNYFLNMTFGRITSGIFNGDHHTGIVLSAAGAYASGTPALPKSASNQVNSSGQRMIVYIRGGEVSRVDVNGVRAFSTSNVSVVLNPGDAIRLTYTTAPEWSWSVLQ